MQWLTLHVVSTNIVRCKKRSRANFTYQPCSAQVTKMSISSGDRWLLICVLGWLGELLVSENGWYSWYFKSFFPHRYRQTVDKSIFLSALAKHLQRFQNWQKQWFFPLYHAALRDTFLYQQQEILTLNKFSFRSSALQRSTEVQDGRKCVGLPLPYYWVVVSTDMLFLQDPLGSCKGNDSVIWGSGSFLEPCDSPYEHQRILVIISEQQFPVGH